MFRAYVSGLVKGWMNYAVEELGGDVWVNGKLYEP